MKNYIKYISTLILGVVSAISAFADNEYYSNKNKSGEDFSNQSMQNSIWESDTLIGTIFSNTNLTDAFFNNTNLTDANFSNANLTDVSFYNTNLTNANFSNANLTNANLSYSTLVKINFSGADLTGVSFDGSEIEKVNFSNVKGLTYEQIKKTKIIPYGGHSGSWSEVDFSNNTLDDFYCYGMDLRKTNFSNTTFTNSVFNQADFRNANLYNANFQNQPMRYADITNTNMKNTDLRGADLSYTEETAITQNTIWNDGIIKNFSMISSADNFAIRAYTPTNGGSMISAKIDTTSTISGGATLTLEQGADLEILENKVLTFGADSNLVIDTDINSATDFIVNANAGLTFEKGATLTINLANEGDLVVEEDLSFTVLKWDATSTISGAEIFEKNKDIFLTVNGEKYTGAWDFVTDGNQLSVNLMAVPEPAEWAMIFGAVALGFAFYRRRK